MFSVVIPLYNKAGHIQRAIGSVLEQTVQDFELIVVNDGSTDGGETLVQACADPRLTLIHQHNRGVSAARNRGIEAGRGDYIAFLDADDQWLPDFLETIVHLIDRFPEAAAYSTSYFVENGRTDRSVKTFKALPPRPWEGIITNYFRIAARNGSPMWTSATCLRRDVFEKVGTFPAGVKKGEDLDLWIRVALHFKVAFSTEPKAVYFLNADNRSTALAGVAKKSPYVLNRLQKRIEDHEIPDNLLPDARRLLASYLIMLADQNMRAGDFRTAERFLSDKRSNAFCVLKLKFLFRYLLYRIKTVLKKPEQAS
jgi:glycosyltransferase involved in cell wall biosynthesis